MKKMLLLLFLAVLQMTSAFGQDSAKGGYRKCTEYVYQYKFGEVDSQSEVKETEFYYDEKGRKIKQINYGSDSVVTNEIWKYNEQGKLIENVRYNGDASIAYKRIDKYGEKGNSSESVCYKGDGSIIWKSNAKHDGKGSILEAKTVNGYSLGLSHYKVAYFARADTLHWKATYKYGDKGNILEEAVHYIKWNSAKDFDGRKNIKKYDEKGKEIERIDFSGKGVREVKETKKYDEKGNLIESIQYFENDSVKSKSIYSPKLKSFHGEIVTIEGINYGENGKTTGAITSRYDEKGNLLVQSDVYDEKGRVTKSDTIAKYNEKGKQIERLYSYSPDWRIVEKYKYDENGNVEIERNSIVSKSKRADDITITKIRYDSKGREIEREEGDKKEEYKYNEKGMLIEKYERTSSRWAKREKFDEYGNRIEFVIYREMDEPEFKSEYIFSK